MKIHCFAAGLALVLTATVLSAQTPAARTPASLGDPTGQGASTHTSEDFSALERFLTMDDAQLDRIQQAVAKVRAMSPAARAALHDQMHAFHQLPEAKRAQVRAGWGWQSDQDRADWPSMMRSLPDSERVAIQTEIQSVSPDRRPARKHELLEIWRNKKANP